MPFRDWLKKPASAPAAAGIDTSGWDEYPVHLMDGSKLNHKVLGWTMRFNDVLDADMLHSALTRLLGVGEWRKLGGRLRRDFKIIAPKEFSISIPAVEYQHTIFPQTISSHAIGAQFIHPTEEPTVQPLDKQLSEFMAPDGYPDTVDGLAQSNKSQLALTITSFDDATLVSLAMPHSLLDASGVVALVQNWSLVLAGRMSDVVPLLNTQHDILEEVTRDNNAVEPQECRMEKMRLTGFAYLKLMGRHMAEAAQRKRRLQALYIPRNTYEKLLVRLGQNNDDDDGKEPVQGEKRISNVQLLTAWLVGKIAAQESAPRPLALITLYDLRFYIQKLKDMQTQKGAGLISQILMSSYCATFSADALRNNQDGGGSSSSSSIIPATTVADLARSYQEQTAALTNEDEAIAHLKIMRRDLCGEKPGFALYGTSDSLVVFCHPLAGLDLVRMADFAAAVVTKKSGELNGDGDGEKGERKGKLEGEGEGEGKGGVTTPAGRIVSSFFNAVNWTDAGVDAVSLLGEDHGGGCWVMAKLSSGSWDSVLGELGDL
ncbi:hypothetical protein E4U21_006867 [Claviceps maximensis]|nr:hypothetical protein E4U21_006867 [Claviceps maximensis]